MFFLLYLKLYYLKREIVVQQCNFEIRVYDRKAFCIPIYVYSYICQAFACYPDLTRSYVSEAISRPAVDLVKPKKWYWITLTRPVGKNIQQSFNHC